MTKERNLGKILDNILEEEKVGIEKTAMDTFSFFLVDFQMKYLCFDQNISASPSELRMITRPERSLCFQLAYASNQLMNELGELSDERSSDRFYFFMKTRTYFAHLGVFIGAFDCIDFFKDLDTSKDRQQEFDFLYPLLRKATAYLDIEPVRELAVYMEKQVEKEENWAILSAYRVAVKFWKRELIYRIKQESPTEGKTIQ